MSDSVLRLTANGLDGVTCAILAAQALNQVDPEMRHDLTHFVQSLSDAHYTALVAFVRDLPDLTR